MGQATALLPKDEGMGIMMSSFCSRKLGYGFNFTPERMTVVNEIRMKEENIQYKDHDASVAINGKNEKKHLPPIHLLLNLIMAPTRMGIVVTITWCCRRKIALMF